MIMKYPILILAMILMAVTASAQTPSAAVTYNPATNTITSGSAAVKTISDASAATAQAAAIAASQPLDSDLTSIAALTTGSFGRSILTGTSAAAVNSLLGLSTVATSGSYSSLLGLPTTLAGYGITDGVTLTGTQSLTNKTINGVTLSGSGTLNIGSGGTLGSAAYLPAGQIHQVALNADRFLLTSGSVHNLDWVKVAEWLPTGSGGAYEHPVYGVMDNTNLAVDAGWVHLGSYTIVPQNLAAPTISGTTPNVGFPISSGSGSWTDYPTAYRYQWQASETGTSGWASLTGTSTQASYTPVMDDVGKFLRCGVRAVNSSGTSSYAYTGVTAATGTSQFPQSGLMNYWNLSSTADLSGTNTLTSTNDVTFSAGKIGNAAVFNGLDNYLSTAGIDMAGGPRTISLWFKRSSLGTGSYQTAFNYDAWGDFELWCGLNAITGSNNSWVYVTGHNTPDFISAVGEWMHVVLTLSGDGSGEVFINGVSHDTFSYNVNTPSNPILSIGAKGDGSVFGQTTVDEVGIWNRVLTPAEITILYNGGAGLTLP